MDLEVRRTVNSYLPLALIAIRPVSELLPRKLEKDFGPLDFKLIRQCWLNRDVSQVMPIDKWPGSGVQLNG